MKEIPEFNIRLDYKLDHEQGFHYNIFYQLELLGSSRAYGNSDSRRVSEFDFQDIDSKFCKANKTPSLILTHNFPSDLFIDPYQLETLVSFFRSELLQNSIFPLLSINSRIELELPAYEVDESLTNSFQIIWGLSNLKSSKMQFSLPIHARYREPDKFRYHSINVSSPSLLFSCVSIPDSADIILQYDLSEKNIAPSSFNLSFSNSPATEWMLVLPSGQRMPFSQFKNLPFLTFTVPSGQPDHQIFVIAVTLICVLLGVFYIFFIARFKAPKLKFLSPPLSPVSYNFALGHAIPKNHIPLLENTSHPVDLARKNQ